MMVELRPLPPIGGHFQEAKFRQKTFNPRVAIAIDAKGLKITGGVEASRECECQKKKLVFSKVDGETRYDLERDNIRGK